MAHSAAAATATAAAAAHAAAAARSKRGDAEPEAEAGVGGVAAAADASPPGLSLHLTGRPFGGGDRVELACGGEESVAAHVRTGVKPVGLPGKAGRRGAEERAPRGAAMRQHTRNTLGCGGGLSAAGKARRCVPPPGAPAGGEQQGTGSQHARDADTAQRDEQRAPGGALVAGCHAYITAVSGARRLAGREWRIDHEDMCACSPTNRSPRRTRHRPRCPPATPVLPTQPVEPSRARSCDTPGGRKLRTNEGTNE